MKNPMLDKDFLVQLSQYRHKEIYAKIISLNFNEEPLETIEGKITGGSINIDGNSAVRRTCSLTMVAKDINLHSFYWNEANKFKLEIGVKNFINYDYPDIIWFNQGLYLITAFNSSLSNNAYNISISGKDKMCLLNGDFGGNLPASIDFGSMDFVEDVYTEIDLSKTYEKEYKANKYYLYDYTDSENKRHYKISTGAYVPGAIYYNKETKIKNVGLVIEHIIREAVHTYAQEPYHNIIINDLTDYGLELIEYRGERPVYLLYDVEAQTYLTMVLDEYANDFKVIVDGEEIPINSSKITPNTEIDNFEKGTKFSLKDKEKLYSTTKIEYGQTIGYRQTDLMYPGELISSIGETLTSILDKIKNMLGSFEYFYDIYGRFVFQAKKIYANNSWNPIVDADDNSFVRDTVEESPYSYSFEDINLISQFSSTPNLQNIKNDYSVWGKRKGVSGADIPIHARYAIHKKPYYYKNLEGKKFYTDEYSAAAGDDALKVDWREIIYQMAVDYFQYETKHKLDLEDFLTAVNDNNIVNGVSLYPAGITGYETFYTDMQGFWRQLYDINKTKSLSSEVGGRYEEKKYEVIQPSQYIANKFYIQKDGKMELSTSNSDEQLYLYPTANHRKVYFKHISLTENMYMPNKYYNFDTNNPPVITIDENDQFNKNISYWEIVNSTSNLVSKKYGSEEGPCYLFKRVYLVKDNFISNRYFIEDQNKIMQFAESFTENQRYYDVVPIKKFYFERVEIKDDKDYNNGSELYTFSSTGQVKAAEKIFNQEKIYWKIITSEMNSFISSKKNSELYFINQDGSFNITKEWVENNSNCYTLDSIGINEDFDEYLIKYEWADYETSYTEQYNDNYWHKNVINAPDLLNFWIDFYDEDTEIFKYSINNLGLRSKVVNDDKVNSVYYRKIPNIIVYFQDENQDDKKTGYSYFRLTNNMKNAFTISAQGKSANNEINNLMNQHSYYSESINITVIPIYDLQPNTLIYIYNQESNINGKYKVDRLTIPLTYNGTMSITATKVIDTTF